MTTFAIIYLIFWALLWVLVVVGTVVRLNQSPGVKFEGFKYGLLEVIGVLCLVYLMFGDK